MIENVLPAIKLKWPDRDHVIVIQQDGASSHINRDDPAFPEAAIAGNWQIVQLLTQPAQSPDTNILDLSFFRALQSEAQWDHSFATEIDGLIAQVIRAYNTFCQWKIDFGFVLTLHSCLDESLLRMEAATTPSTIWGRSDFLELVLFHFMLVQELMPSGLQGRLGARS
jgi:hypothetical protein